MCISTNYPYKYPLQSRNKHATLNYQPKKAIFLMVGNVFDQPLPEDEYSPSDGFERRPRNNKLRFQQLTPSQITEGRTYLQSLVYEAFAVLREAMNHAEYPTAMAAAKIVLDRSGFGPESTLKVEHQALSEVPTEKLQERFLQLLNSTPEGQVVVKKVLSDRFRGLDKTRDAIH